MPTYDGECYSNLAAGEAYWTSPFGIDPQASGVPAFEFGTDSVLKNVDSAFIDSHATPVASSLEGGSCVPGYKEWFYNTIYVIPNTLSLGYVLANADTQVEVWNAYLEESKNLSAINGPTEEEVGMTLTPNDGIDPPTNYGILESRYYTLAVDAEGPPSVDAQYDFVFEGETPNLTVSGFRLLIWGYVPQERHQEIFKWLTDTMESFDGDEQFVKIRTRPRRELSYRYISADTVQRGRLFNLLAAGIGFDFGVPMWQQSRNLTLPTGAGGTTVMVDTTNSEYVAGGGCFLWTDDFNKEAAEIATVLPDRLELLTAVTLPYDEKSYCMPLAICELPINTQSSLYALNATTLDIVFRMLGSTDLGTASLTDQYKGLDVLHDCPEIPSSTVTWTHSGNWLDVDFQTGLFNNDYTVPYAKTTRAFRKTFSRDLDAVWQFKQWLNKMAGKVGVFWVPSYTGKLRLVGPVTQSQVLINVENADLTIVYNNTSWVTDIEFEFLDGTIERRDVTLVRKVDSTIEEITIFSEIDIGKTFTMDDIKQISLLHRVRLDSDTITFDWDLKEQCTVTFNTREVLS